MKITFNLSLSQQKFPTLQMQTVVDPVFKNSNCASASNHKPISTLNNYFKVPESVIYDHVSHYFKHPFQH